MRVESWLKMKVGTIWYEFDHGWSSYKYWNSSHGRYEVSLRLSFVCRDGKTRNFKMESYHEVQTPQGVGTGWTWQERTLTCKS